ncbi:APC family permease [Streptomyces sp. LHD-70]|uniref:APC family permease n=1 Tax=Streptomyces sp. LHD-70 TaxID=3072140 RepID=UPI002810948F|nr:APC family permease [Streptomyces sp. LHD-70]MDQ8706108.1 APC family permease [Streptomyces sp. LHD-70]
MTQPLSDENSPATRRTTPGPPHPQERRATRQDHGLEKNALGAPAIVFYIIAAASPLTGVVAIVPIMIGTGNGVGTPASFLIAACLLLVFAVGYLAMSRHVTNAGALYAYVTMGLGRTPGLGTASVTVFAYSCIQFSLYGGFGYYLSSLLNRATGASVPWWTCAAFAMLCCLLIGLRGVHAGGRVLGVLICLECAMLLTLGLGVIFHPNSSTPTDFSAEPFTLPAIAAAGVGISIMFAQTTFIGFEGSAIYSEEAKKPSRTIPRATYFSVVFMAVVYAVTSYLIIAGTGTDKAQSIAQRESGSLVFFVSDRAMGSWASDVFQVLIITSIFAAIVTFHNNLSRYLYALGRQGLVWERLGHTLPGRRTPYIAAIAQTASAAVVVGLFAVLGLDPYTTLFTWLAGIGTVGIIGAQVVAALAILVFFRRTKVDQRTWHTRIAPAIAVAGMMGMFIVALSSLDLLLGASTGLTALLVGLLALSAAAGTGYAFWLRRHSAEKYERMRIMLSTKDS